MSTFFDPSKVNLIDAPALAEFLEALDSDALRDVEEAFRLAAYGRPLTLNNDPAAAKFNGTTTIIPWEIASLIRSHRLHGTPFLAALNSIAKAVADGFTDSEVAALQASMDDWSGTDD